MNFGCCGNIRPGTCEDDGISDGGDVGGSAGDGGSAGEGGSEGEGGGDGVGEGEGEGGNEGVGASDGEGEGGDVGEGEGEVGSGSDDEGEGDGVGGGEIDNSEELSMSEGDGVACPSTKPFVFAACASRSRCIAASYIACVQFNTLQILGFDHSSSFNSRKA